MGKDSIGWSVEPEDDDGYEAANAGLKERFRARAEEKGLDVAPRRTRVPAPLQVGLPRRAPHLLDAR